MTEYILVYTTVENKEDGIRLGRLLVAQKLVACVQISDLILSIYRWQGRLEQGEEYRMSMKTRADLFAEIEVFMGQHHPYEIAELIATPLCHCSKTYQKWLCGELKHGG